MSFEDLSDRLAENRALLLPLFLLVMVIIGNVMFAVRLIVPHLITYNELVTEVEGNREVLRVSLAAAEGDETILLQSQITRLEDQLVESAGIFLNDYQAESMLNWLYGYAHESGVEITSLQTQTPDTPGEVYDMRDFRLQVQGPVRQLMVFLAQINEAAAPSVVISNIAFTSDTLTMDVRIYFSPLASGAVLDNLPLVVFPTSVAPVPTNAPPTPLPTLQAGATPVDVVTAIGGDSEIPVDTSCPGAPPTWFQPGDIAIVDFNRVSSLNILLRPRVDSVEVPVLDRAYDNDQLQILAGPVCGTWRGLNVWYWYVDYRGIKGWAGEGTGISRWLCPVDMPECA
jgi:hypothetical protein